MDPTEIEILKLKIKELQSYIDWQEIDLQTMKEDLQAMKDELEKVSES